MATTTNTHTIGKYATAWRRKMPWADSYLRMIALDNGAEVQTGEDVSGRLVFRFVASNRADAWRAMNAARNSPESLTYN